MSIEVDPRTGLDEEEATTGELIGARDAYEAIKSLIISGAGLKGVSHIVDQNYDALQAKINKAEKTRPLPLLTEHELDIIQDGLMLRMKALGDNPLRYGTGLADAFELAVKETLAIMGKVGTSGDPDRD